MDLGQNETVYTYKTSKGNTDYYIFEGRYPKDNIEADPLMSENGYCGNSYPYALKGDEGILLYKVTKEMNSLINQPKIYTIPHSEFFFDAQNTVTLIPGDSYTDEEAEVKFIALKDVDGLKINVSKFTPISKKIISLFNVSLGIHKGSGFQNPIPTENIPDIDLHMYSYDGKMVGMDYNSLNYENQIIGATTSGNIPGGGPEWISIPRDIKTYYTVDVSPLKKWAEETNTPLENVSVMWNVIDYDEKGSRRESDPIEVKINIDKPTTLAIKADIDIKPDTINLKSKGNWITAYIELPKEYDINKIDRSTILLNHEISAEIINNSDYKTTDQDNDGILDIMVKFDREKVIEMIKRNVSNKRDFNFDIIGEVVHNQIPILFEGADNVNIIPK